MLAGILSHEIGHAVTSSVRFAPAVSWFSLPWRLASRLIVKATARMAGKQPRGLPAVVVVSTIAIVQAFQQRQWSTVVVLCALGFFPLIVPPADAALSRAGERQADRYAAAFGYGDALGTALRGLAGHRSPSESAITIVDTHPSLSRRSRDLATTQVERPT
jgi:Zn-dependent protease with chaperone function